MFFIKSAMRIIFILFFITITSSAHFAQKLDCNKDGNCVKMVLTKGRSTIGWKLIESKELNWDDNPCSESTNYYFLFKDNDSLFIYKRTTSCKSQILNSKFIFKTTYNIITLKYQQLGIRIFMVDPNIRKFLGGLKKGLTSISGFTDFQFLNIKTQTLILRANTDLTETGTIDNSFE
jgi:hypothetical protein